MKKTFIICTAAFPLFFSSDLSAKEQTRLSNGSPSSSYWQQKTDYRIRATLDVETNVLSGSGVITYYNNSPDTLRTIVWHLYQNIFRKDSSPRKNDEQSSRAFKVTDGITIESLTINGEKSPTVIDETIMETPLSQPLLPKTSATIDVVWRYDIPKSADLRTGREKNDFGICQWYPQIAVYDDVRGWDRTQYRGISEFYTNFGDWEVAVTVPKNFIVASTGSLMNPEDVLSSPQLNRFNSLSADSIVRIILPGEVEETGGMISTETTEWNFTAENVRDFAWAASTNFVWDGILTDDGVRIYSFYHPKEYRASFPVLISDATNWDDAALIAKHTIEYNSKHFGRYVYPQATVVSGPVVGMEYPMMVFAESGSAVINFLPYTIVHELSHQWWPMMVGSNETDYPFMDEGFTTFITTRAVEDRLGNDGFLSNEFLETYSWMNLPETNTRLFEQRAYLRAARSNNEASIMTHPYAIPSSQFGVMAYQKPASVLVMLEDVLGAETFSKGMNAYYSRWLFKHPSPEDFFNTMEDAAGRNLDWFWNQWFYQSWKLDLAVDNVINQKTESGWQSVITLRSKEQVIMPATLRLTLADGTVRDIRFSETVWSKGTRADIRVDSLPAEATNVVIDPGMKLADINRLNNSWLCPPIVFDYGLNIFNTLAYPLDAYRINAGPAVGFTLRDGFELGTIITGSYMGTDNEVSLYLTDGIRSNVPDYELSYSTPLRVWDPQLTTSARIFRLDGFTGWQWIIEKTFDQRKRLAQNLKRSFVINTSILSIRVNDDRYLTDRAEWDLRGVLDAGFISLKYYDDYSWGKIFVRLDDEFGTPTSAFSYSKLTSEMMLSHSVFGLKMNWRVFGGSSVGNVPVQTAHSLTQASPLDRFDTKFFRTPIFGGAEKQKFIKSGGGNLFLQHDTTALNVAAANVSLSKGPLVLFADAGTLWDTTTARFKKFFFDAGIGVQMNFGSVSVFNFRSRAVGFGIFFPLFVKDPSRPNDKELDYRWLLAFGVRL